MEQTKTKFEYPLPQREADRILNSGFYVKMNCNWTATVRSLKEFINAINEHTLDENFGIITKDSSDEEQGNFYHYLVKIICAYKGFAPFNNCKHTFVELKDKQETISIKTANGELITVCVMEGAGCVDIKYHTADMEKHDNGSKDGLDQFEIIGFHGGGTPVKKTALTLMTILLKPFKKK